MPRGLPVGFSLMFTPLPAARHKRWEFVHFASPGGMFDKAGIGISGIQATVAPTRAAVEAARQAGMKIVYLKTYVMEDS